MAEKRLYVPRMGIKFLGSKGLVSSASVFFHRPVQQSQTLLIQLGPGLNMIRKVLSETGKCLRETGQALDRLGSRAMGDHISFRETWSRHRKLMNLYNKRPVVAVDTFVAPNASVIGDVNIGDKSSVWYGAVIRGDVNKIQIGSLTNIQDRVVVHASKPNKDGGFPTTTTIGDYVTIGHGAVLSSCVIENNVLIGPNALILDGALVESNSIVEPGSVVPPGRR
jgi:carbonic anhydrase/acetyltransferase-like protein (isoleucine patch superfamily)